MNMNSNGYLNFLSINSVPDAARSLKPEPTVQAGLPPKTPNKSQVVVVHACPSTPHEPCGVISRDKTLRLFIIPATRGS